MLCGYLVLLYLIGAALANMQAQDVKLMTTPRIQDETSSSTMYYVTAQVGGTFMASVTLRASSLRAHTWLAII